MYNLDYFSYWKEPIVRINRIGIYPLDEPGKTKYFSKDSYTHHYLRKTDPYVFKEITGRNINNVVEENKQTMKRREEWEENEKSKLLGSSYRPSNTEVGSQEKKVEKTESYLKTEGADNNEVNTSSKINDRYGDLKIKSQSKKNKLDSSIPNTLSRTGYNLTNSSPKKFKFGIYRSRLGRSVDQMKRGILGYKTINNNKSKCKLPDIFGKSENNLRISMIGTISSKEMGESYNPYNFISPSINRTKRNYVGGLFHC